MISSNDRKMIRGLAEKVRQISAHPEMHSRKKRWLAHNRLEQGRPMVMVFAEGAWNELLPYTVLRCESGIAREYEWKLRYHIYRYENFMDDFVMERDWHVLKRVSDTGWGLDLSGNSKKHTETGCFEFHDILGFYPKVWERRSSYSGESWGFEPVINTFSDLKKLKCPEVLYDEAGTLEELQQAQELFGDILDVKLKGKSHLSFHLMQTYTEMRGLEQVMWDMYDEPEMLHEAMAFLEEGYRGLFRQYIDNGLLSLNNDATYHSSGGVGYSDLLPRKGYEEGKIRLCDLWASAESQELAQVSPEMHAEFVLPYEKRLLEPFGLTGYGCCEDLTKKLKDILAISNLRRVSISPWADVRKCAEQIKGNCIFSWKPHPAYMVGEFNSDSLRQYVKNVLEATKENGCVLEIILKDTNTCECQPERFTLWTRTVKQLLDEY